MTSPTAVKVDGEPSWQYLEAQECSTPPNRPPGQNSTYSVQSGSSDNSSYECWPLDTVSVHGFSSEGNEDEDYSPAEPQPSTSQPVSSSRPTDNRERDVPTPPPEESPFASEDIIKLLEALDVDEGWPQTITRKTLQIALCNLPVNKYRRLKYQLKYPLRGIVHTLRARQMKYDKSRYARIRKYQRMTNLTFEVMKLTTDNRVLTDTVKFQETANSVLRRQIQTQETTIAESTVEIAQLKAEVFRTETVLTHYRRLRYTMSGANAHRL